MMSAAPNQPVKRAIPLDILRLVPSALPAHIAEARDALRAAVPTPLP